MAQQTAPTDRTPRRDHDFMPLNGVDHVELCVGNAQQAAFYYVHAFGFREVAYAAWRPACATAPRTCSSRAGSASCSPARCTRTRPSPPTSQHGDGVKVIALCVPDVDHA